MFKRHEYEDLIERFRQPRRFMQVLIGPRQTGKTTLAQQITSGLDAPSHYASADDPALRDRAWLEQQWERGRSLASERAPALLVLDEIQKIPGWSETVKRLWDEDTVADRLLHVMLLGSSALLVRQGMSESLAGRYEVTRITHWSFAEMQGAFGFGLDDYLFYGGYPGAAALVNDPGRWSGYVTESLIEPTISRDILLMTRVDKPALLRQLFELACHYSGQVLSYTKMVGQLQDAGNTTTLAHYLELLRGAGLVAGLQKFSGRRVRQRASSPKLIVLNTALMTAPSRKALEQTRHDAATWGRLVETAVGAGLANGVAGSDIELSYWSSRNREVDFVLSRGDELVAIEVKSGLPKAARRGMEAFAKQHPVRRSLLVGAEGIPLEEFFLRPPESWFD